MMVTTAAIRLFQVFDDLEDEGHFYDPLSKEVKEVFLPWLMDDVVHKVDKAVESMAVVDGKPCSAQCRHPYAP